MGHFAKVENGTVTQVIVADQDFIDTGAVGDPGTWVQTSYNTQGGTHRNGGTPLRKNYAGIGYLYDGIGFYAPSPYPSWTKDEATYQWSAPTPMPVVEGKMFTWDEPTLAWVERVIA